MQIVVSKYHGRKGNWYEKYPFFILDVSEQEDNYVLEKTNHNLSRLKKEELETINGGESLMIPKNYAETVLEEGPLILYKVLMNDGGWRSGDMPSEMIVARSKAEACGLCREKRYISQDMSVSAHEFTIKGYDILLKKKES